jgi:hypothetical protein
MRWKGLASIESMGAAGAGALCGRARRGPEARPGRGGRPLGCRSFGRLGIGARSCGGPPQGACLMGSGSRVAPWDSRRGRALDCAQGAAPAGRLARRRAGGGRGAGWRVLSELDSLGPGNSGSGDIGYGFVDFRGPKYRGS